MRHSLRASPEHRSWGPRYRCSTGRSVPSAIRRSRSRVFADILHASWITLFQPAVDTAALATFGMEIGYLVNTLRAFLPLNAARDALASANKVPYEVTKCLNALEISV